MRAEQKLKDMGLEPGYRDHTRQQGSGGEGGNANHDDLARAVAVGADAADGGQQRTRDAGHGVGQGHGGRAPAHVLLQGDDEHSERLPDGTAGHMHESRDGDDDPGVMDPGR